MKRGDHGKSKYFQTTKRGEIKDWKDQLNSLNRNEVKEAVKKVIAAMTVGKDVSVLFPDVIKSMPTDNLELKKLVYLYIINYARSQPDKAIMVINTFQKDASIETQPNPLIRALAIRTMGCIRVDRITEHLCDPLGRALEEEDPYVKKTAAICVAKLYDMNPELVEERGFITKLRELLSDGSPMVVANAVAALAEISEAGQNDVFHITPAILDQLLTALNECTEWGQVFILDSLAKYEPTVEEAVSIAERVAPRLKHSNSSLVLAAIKVIIKYLDVVSDDSAVKLLSKKLSPPLVTLLSAEPEIQYVALRNIDLIVQRRPEILAKDIRVFFCKYNDPPYVKMEKLEIMVKLAANSNIEQLLLEFKEYAQAIDVEFVRRSVRAIGRCAIKLEAAAERCVRVLLDLIDTKVNYVVQEAVIVIKDIFRRYPDTYEGVIVNLCENLEALDEPEAKAAMIWIIGEYASRIEDAGERLEMWLETFEEESAEVQLQLLTAIVKLFLTDPEEGKDMVKRVLELTTESVDNPDLRDRGYVYWRLLASDPEAAKDVVLAEKPVISDETFRVDDKVLDVLIANIATLSSVYHKPPESFVRGIKTIRFHAAEDEEEESEEEESEYEESEEEEDESEDVASLAVDVASDGVDSSEEEKDVHSPSSEKYDFPESKKFNVLSAEKGNGLQIQTSLTREDGTGILRLHLFNKSDKALPQLAVQFKKNALGVAPVSSAVSLQGPVKPGKRDIVDVPLSLGHQQDRDSKPGVIQVALKTHLGVLYFACPISAHIFFEEDGQLQKKEFLSQWKSIDTTNEISIQIDNTFEEVEDLVDKLDDSNIFKVAELDVPQKGRCIYCSMGMAETIILAEFVIGAHLAVNVKSSDAYTADLASKAIKLFLTAC